MQVLQILVVLVVFYVVHYVLMWHSSILRQLLEQAVNEMQLTL